MSTTPVVVEPVVAKKPLSNLSPQHEKAYQALAEPLVAVQPPVISPPPAIPLAQPNQAPVEALPAQPPPETPKLFAGKYKTVEELEKGYDEAQKAFHGRSQELADLKKQRESVLQAVQPEAPKPAATEAPPVDLLDLLVNKPDEFRQAIVGEVAQYVTAYQTSRNIEDTWKRENSDLVPHSHLVTAEIQRLVREKPESTSNPTALLADATKNIRQLFNSSFAAGKQEAAQVMKEASGSSLSSVAQSAEHGTPPPVPATTPDSYFDDYLAERKARNKKLMQDASTGVGRLHLGLGQ